MAYVVITGATRGLGVGIANAFAKRGHNLILSGRNKEDLAEVKRTLQEAYPSLSVLTYSVDLLDKVASYAFFEFANNKGVDVWINNAGRGYRGKTSALDDETLENLLDLNVKATARLSTWFVAKHDKGTLINVASSMGYTLSAEATLYSASKFFVTSFTEGLYLELQEKKPQLQVKLYAPSAIRTNFSFVAGNLADKDYDKVFKRYHTKEQAGEDVYTLYKSEHFLGLVEPKDYVFRLHDLKHAHFASVKYGKN